MANLIVRNIDETIVKALKKLESKPQRKSFADLLSQIPNVGNDSDFERVHYDLPYSINYPR
jgi:antitoxin FitA